MQNVIPLRRSSTSLEQNSLQIVILECPIQSIHDSFTQEIFGKILELKIKSYQFWFGKNALPLDAIDFIACHLLLCTYQEKQWIPILAYKLVSLKTCEAYQLEFPIMTHFKNCLKAKPHFKVIQTLMNQAQQEKKEIYWCGGFMISLKFIPMKNHLENLMRAMHVFYHLPHSSFLIFTVASQKFKTQNLFTQAGYQFIQSHGQDCPAIPLPSYYFEEVLIMYQKALPNSEIQHAQAYQALWNKRIHIDPSIDSEITPLRAA